ncbi:MAG TPA: hypothetical protein VF765_29365 [Polyangiaceae bacterium]
MAADDLLRHIGEHARNGAAASPDDDPVWERLAKGELTADEDAELRKRAAADPQTATLYEAYRPLDASLKKRIAAHATAALAPRSRVLSWRRAAVIIAPLAAAAAIAVVVMRRPTTQDGAPALPLYAMDFQGGDRTTRSAEPTAVESTKLHRGSHVEVVLRPATAVSAPVSVRTFVVQGDAVRALDLPAERSSDGAIRIQGDAGALFHDVPAGAWDLAVTVGAEGAAPPHPSEVVSALRGDGGRHVWQLLHRRIELLDTP